MGFYLRKSLRVGPFRFNLSKSGIGVSAGVRGLRLGAGPSGNYIHMGRGGLYYRATIPKGAGPPGRALNPMPEASPEGGVVVDGSSLREIDSGDVSLMRDSSSDALLSELDRKRKLMRVAPVVAIGGGSLVALLVAQSAPAWVLAAAGLVAVAAFAYAHVRDQLNKTVVLFYELEADAEGTYQGLHDAFAALEACEGSWHIEAEGDVADRKRSAGATSVVRREKIRLTKSSPPFVEVNVATPAIPVGTQTLYLFPDRVLVFQKDAVGAVPYADITIDRRATRFIEHGPLPRDAKVVGQTWKYVNKKGGPDRRFKDNQELPIALYEDVHIRSRSGLNELIQFSRENAAERFEAALKNLSSTSSR